MTVRCQISVFAVLLALLGGAGCSDRAREPLPAETDEPFYVQGKQLMKQGRNPEALTAFLKVIDRRGEAGAAESHLEAGHIYLHYTKDPVEAYHHFRKYLSLQPNSKEAPGVKGKVADALREFARTLPARPMEDQSARLEVRETFEKLQRENEELRAQLSTLRGGAQSLRSAPITVPDDIQGRGAPITPVAPAPDSAGTPPPFRSTTPPSGPVASSPLSLPQAAPPQAQQKQQPATARPTAPPAGRTHVVQPKEGLYGISVKHYGSGKHVKAIYQANRDIMKSESDLRPGMVLKIPPVEGAPATKR